MLSVAEILTNQGYYYAMITDFERYRYRIPVGRNNHGDRNKQDHPLPKRTS